MAKAQSISRKSQKYRKGIKTWHTTISDKNYRKNKQSIIMNRKLSSVLDASPLKNSYIGKIFHERY